MRHRCLGSFAILLAFCTEAAAQESPIKVDLRVTSVGAGATVVIDRGLRDGLARGDQVVLLPRGGARYRGSIIQVGDRASVVEMHDKGHAFQPGTRGEIMIPASRRATPKAKPQPKPRKPAPAKPEAKPVEKPKPEPERPRWQNPDDEYEVGMPLLAQVSAVRPETRATQLTGRFYSTGNLTHNPGESLRNSYLRAGTEVHIDNPFGYGGGAHVDGEINYKTEHNDVAGPDLVLKRASYYRGGTRFDDHRWEVGRFLQHGMPEFGVLDGVEWGRRHTGIGRYGVSFGFMPELSDDFTTGEDLQLGAYYLWSQDEQERFTIGGGIQKTFHKGKGDRDLVVLKTRYLPLDGWNVDATAWIDFYYGRDDAKGNGPELTQALASVGRRFENGDGVNFTVQRVRFPEMLRYETIPPLLQELADKRYDRIGANGWTWLNARERLHGHLSFYDDEKGSGGAAELGLEVKDLFLDHSLADVTVFGGLARFNDFLGVRCSYAVMTEGGRWDAAYEVGYHHTNQLTGEIDELIQHRLRAGRTFHTDTGWNLSIHGETRLWDDEVSYSVGFHVQRSF